MGLKSDLLKGNLRLERCLVEHSAHVTLNDKGEHVGRIQVALQLLDDAAIERTELSKTLYGRSTASAVLAYKTKRKIINTSYQTKPDNIVGKMTIASLDEELVKLNNRPTPPPIPPNPPKPTNVLVKFIPAVPAAPRPEAKSLVGPLRASSFTPLGPVFEGNGFDPDPRRDKTPGLSFQMVPVGGKRSLRILDAGFAGGKPTLRFSLTGASGTTNVPSVVEMQEVQSGALMIREVQLTGKGLGAAVLQAINNATNQVEATLEIAVLAPKVFKLGFMILSDGKHNFTQQGTPQQFVDVANKIWGTQANITFQAVGGRALPITVDLGDEPPQFTLKALAPTLKQMADIHIGAVDRHVLHIWAIGNANPFKTTAGFTADVIYISQIVRPEMSILSHEFGHSVGLKHSSATGNFNLMLDTARLDAITTSLNKSQIIKANLNPGTFHEVEGQD